MDFSNKCRIVRNCQRACILGAYIAGLQFDDLRLSNFSLKSYENYFDGAKQLRKKFDNLKDPDNFEEKRYLETLKYELDFLIKHFHNKGYLLAPVGFFGGVQSTLPNYFMENKIFK